MEKNQHSSIKIAFTIKYENTEEIQTKFGENNHKETLKYRLCVDTIMNSIADPIKFRNDNDNIITLGKEYEFNDVEFDFSLPRLLRVSIFANGEIAPKDTFITSISGLFLFSYNMNNPFMPIELKHDKLPSCFLPSKYVNNQESRSKGIFTFRLSPVIKFPSPLNPEKTISKDIKEFFNTTSHYDVVVTRRDWTWWKSLFYGKPWTQLKVYRGEQQNQNCLIYSSPIFVNTLCFKIDTFNIPTSQLIDEDGNCLKPLFVLYDLSRNVTSIDLSISGSKATDNNGNRIKNNNMKNISYDSNNNYNNSMNNINNNNVNNNSDDNNVNNNNEIDNNDTNNKNNKDNNKKDNKESNTGNVRDTGKNVNNDIDINNNVNTNPNKKDTNINKNSKNNNNNKSKNNNDSSNEQQAASEYGKSLAIEKRDSSEQSFMQFLCLGVRIKTIIGIDFSSSNRPVLTTNTLHSGNLDTNLYASAMRSIFDVLSVFDEHHSVSLFGLCAKIDGVLDEFFPLETSQEDNGKVVVRNEFSTQEAMVKAYNAYRTRVQFWGPTKFSNFLKRAREIAKETYDNNPNIYTVVCVITDGNIVDLQDIVNTILKMSKDPISIVFVGVGEENSERSFQGLRKIDDNLKSMRNTAGMSTIEYHDIVTFVHFKTENIAVPSTFCKNAFKEIPDALSLFMNKNRSQKDDY